MATNIYLYRETIWFGSFPNEGSEYWGWNITTGSSSKSFTGFGSKETMDRVMEDLKAKIKKLRGFKKYDDDTVEKAAILVMAYHTGDPETIDYVDDVFDKDLSPAADSVLKDHLEKLRDWLDTKDLYGRNDEKR